ncbi:MAG TPA: hypothetical protein VIH78_09720 [Terriglobales bacterium]
MRVAAVSNQPVAAPIPLVHPGHQYSPVCGYDQNFSLAAIASQRGQQ